MELVLSSAAKPLITAAPNVGDAAAARSASGTMALIERAGLGTAGGGLISAAGFPPRFIHHRQASLQPTESQGAERCSALTCVFSTRSKNMKVTKQQMKAVEMRSRIEGSASIAAAVA